MPKNEMTFALFAHYYGNVVSFEADGTVGGTYCVVNCEVVVLWVQGDWIRGETSTEDARLSLQCISKVPKNVVAH